MGGGATGHRGRPWQTGSLLPGVREGGGALPKPCDSPTSCLRLTDQTLEPILISKLGTPRSTNVTFREQPKKKKKRSIAMVSRLLI
jgi:hypothetical protein